MLKLMLWLQGKKTYIAAASIVLLALDQWLTGNATLAEALNEALKGLGLAALRAGVNKVGTDSGDEKRTEQLGAKNP